MLNFTLGVVYVFMALAIAVWSALLIAIAVSISGNWSKRVRMRQVMPPPDKAAERMFGQQYFERAIGRKD